MLELKEIVNSVSILSGKLVLDGKLVYADLLIDKFFDLNWVDDFLIPKYFLENYIILQVNCLPPDILACLVATYKNMIINALITSRLDNPLTTSRLEPTLLGIMHQEMTFYSQSMFRVIVQYNTPFAELEMVNMKINNI